MVNDETTIAEAFNSFFIEKISKLKEEIDASLVKDPLENLQKNVNKSHLFTLGRTIAKTYTTTAREPSIYIRMC